MIINCIFINNSDFIITKGLFLDSFLVEKNELTPLEFVEISKQLTEGEEDGKQSM